MNPPIPGEVLIMGAGSVGCWIGGRLASQGVRVHFVGRPRMIERLREHGLTVTDLDGHKDHLRPQSLSLHTTLPQGLAPALVLLTVKSGATAQAAAELGASLPQGAVVLSLQNGVGNAERAQAAAPALTLLSGMVPYNIAELGPGHLHRGTAGRLAVQDHAALAPWLPVFNASHLAVKAHADMRSVQWGKLLINLNNPVNALSGLPLRAQLLDGRLRRCFAALIEEALGVLQQAGIEPARVTALAPDRLIRVLRLPTPIFRLVAAKMLRIDDKARSSMADDLKLGRPTEIDALCGAVSAMAQAQGRDAPMNRAMLALVKQWPEAPRPWAGKDLWAALRHPH